MWLTVSQDDESRIMKAVNQRHAELQRRDKIIDKITQLRREEQSTAQREEELVAECSVEDRRRWKTMLEADGPPVPPVLSPNQTDNHT